MRRARFQSMVTRLLDEEYMLPEKMDLQYSHATRFIRVSPVQPMERERESAQMHFSYQSIYLCMLDISAGVQEKPMHMHNA